MNFPRIMKNVKRLAHFGNDVWLIKSTNSPKIIPKILFHTIEWGPWFEIRHCIRKFHDIRRLNRMCWAIVRHHLPHMRFPLRIIHIVHHPVMVFDHHADLQLAIDSIWCHHLVNSDTFTLQLIEVSQFIFFLPYHQLVLASIPSHHRVHDQQRCHHGAYRVWSVLTTIQCWTRIRI